jgi:hypothetical protein
MNKTNVKQKQKQKQERDPKKKARLVPPHFPRKILIGCFFKSFTFCLEHFCSEESYQQNGSSSSSLTM